MEYIPAPFPRYNGGKSGSGTYHGIINHIPPVKCLISPFAGNGGVERRINMRGGVIVLNDLDRAVYNKYKLIVGSSVTEHPHATICILSTNGMSLLNHLFIGRLLFNATMRSKSDKNWPYQNSDVLFYCDPPYLFDTRKSTATLYKYEWGYDDHVAFLKAIAGLNNEGYKIAISHPPHILYENMLPKWSIYDYSSMTSSGKKMHDRLWYNYLPPVELQDYQYLGNDYRQREVIARRIKRTAANVFKTRCKDPRMQALQVNATIDKILEIKNKKR